MAMTRRSKKSARVSKRKVSRKGSKKVSRKGKKGSRKGTKKRGLLARLRSRMRRGKRGSRKSKGKNSVAVLVPAKGGQRGAGDIAEQRIKAADLTGDTAKLAGVKNIIRLNDNELIGTGPGKIASQGTVKYKGTDYSFVLLNNADAKNNYDKMKLASADDVDALFVSAGDDAAAADGAAGAI